jgi:TatD DNase family protein
MLIDIGANLAHESFDADREAMLQRARAAGVEAIIVTGSSLDSTRQAIAQVQDDAAAARIDHPQLYATAGLHPHHAAEWSDTLAAQFRTLAAATEVVAVGECGLDYFRDLSPRQAQRAAFVAQLQIAVENGKPLFLHQRDAHADFAAILREHRAQLSDCVVHCFTDTAAALDDYLALDCHIGITGWICDERRGTHLLELARRIPADRLLIETDAPYLLPRTIKPAPKHRRNEPSFLPAVLTRIAEARSDDQAALAAQTTLNARRFFRLPTRAA